MTAKLTKEEQKKVSVDEYELGTIQVFMSYSTDDKNLAGRIKRILEGYGLSVFLAHDDIEPTFEWQTEIIKNLNKCDVFIPILTRSFSNSKWTDQEVGIAFGLEKLIIPLKVDTDPYGFISKLQACKLDVDNPSRSCFKIIKVLKNSKFSERLFDCLLRELEFAPTFDYATKQLKKLDDFAPFNEEQVNQIMRIAIRNNQFRLCGVGKTFLTSLIKEYTPLIDPFLLGTYNKVKENF